MSYSNNCNYRRIALVGCGQIGSRHLQAIVKVKRRLKVQVVEPSNASQDLGKKRLKEVPFSTKDIQVEWLKDIDNLEKQSDLTVVATNAQNRSKIIEKLIKIGHRRFLIEKMVCQSTEEYERLLESFDEYKAKGWVNCPRRYYPFYQKIINLLKGDSPLIFNVVAGNQRLGCNAIHFLDLFAACVRNYENIELDGNYLFPKLLSNRRGKDFVEFAGTIIAKIDGNFASLAFHPVNPIGASLTILSENNKIFVDEENRKAFLVRRKNNWKKEAYPFKEIYTSTLTTKIAKEIIEDDTCKLPALQDLYYLHKELFRIFNQHIRLMTGRSMKRCPIT